MIPSGACKVCHDQDLRAFMNKNSTENFAIVIIKIPDFFQRIR